MTKPDWLAVAVLADPTRRQAVADILAILAADRESATADDEQEPADDA